jgi:hypothetical protein
MFAIAPATSPATAPPPTTTPASDVLAEKLNRKPGMMGMLAFGVVLIIGVILIG